MSKGYEQPEGWTFQGFSFDLDPTPEQEQALRRFFGARRFAHNWAIDQLKGENLSYSMTGMSFSKPTAFSYNKRWNREKHWLAVDRETGQPWWQEVGFHVYEDGIRSAVEAYWNWQQSRSGKRAGRPVGFPRFHGRGKNDSFTIRRTKTGTLVGRGFVQIPKLGKIKTLRSTRKLVRLMERGEADALAITISYRHGRLHAAIRACILRPQRNHKPAQPGSRVGVDVGERVLAVVAQPDGTIVERVENPKALKEALPKLRRLNRKLARQKRGSNRYIKNKEAIAKLHHRTARIRSYHVHQLTSRLSKTHAEIVIEDLNVAGMRMGGAKHMRDAPLGEFRRQMTYKTEWYNSTLVLADRFYPSSKTCSACGEIGDPGSRERWTCDLCGVIHNRDDNAAINLARWSPNQSNRGFTPVQAGTVRSVGARSTGRNDGSPAVTLADVLPCEPTSVGLRKEASSTTVAT